MRADPAAERRAADVARQAATFAALGDATRLRLVALLCTGAALSIAQLTEAQAGEAQRAGSAALTRQAVTKHLSILADAGLVQHVKAGRERLWTLQAAPLAEARASLDAISTFWDDALQRLKTLVESG